ncbi:heavy metal-associated isoprenylated plant protein 32-like [Neltuma alba]|uniref:heavy metal-associated isoprenylated plant protein 32-like n=1 Tax=Neltuma alba TaxID=207710 RepID=UPI0010A32C20|nr:heavy metal-associated isoprenylated plant protein 32-like [Prosopis alba]
MNQEEIAKIRKYVLKVNIHCGGCKHKVKKVLRKIDGVYITEIDSEQGKVTVTGNVDLDILIKKLLKSGKHAEPWGAPKVDGNNNNKNSNNNQNQLANQMKNVQINNNGGKGSGENSKGQQKGGGNNQPKDGQQPPNLQQQLQQMKGFQDQKLPLQFNDMKLPGQLNPNPKAVKFNLPEDDDCLDDEFDDDESDDDEFDDEIGDPQVPLNMMKGLPPMGNGAHMMMNSMMNGNQQQQLLNALKNANVEANGKKGNCGGGGPMPIQTPSIGSGNSGKKGGGGGGGGGNNQNQGGGNKSNSGKNGIGIPQGINGNNGNKNSGGANGANLENNNGDEGQKGNLMPGGVQAVKAMGGHHPNMSGGNTGPIGNMNTPMGNIPTVQGLLARGMNSGGGGSGGDTAGYSQGLGPESMAGNPFQHQQYMAAMMNHQRAMGMAGGNDKRFQPMMYARPPPAVNYMYPQQYPYPYPPPPQDPYTHFFNDENTSSCNIILGREKETRRSNGLDTLGGGISVRLENHVIRTACCGAHSRILSHDDYDVSGVLPVFKYIHLITQSLFDECGPHDAVATKRPKVLRSFLQLSTRAPEHQIPASSLGFAKLGRHPRLVCGGTWIGFLLSVDGAGELKALYAFFCWAHSYNIIL